MKTWEAKRRWPNMSYHAFILGRKQQHLDLPVYIFTSFFFALVTAKGILTLR